jgi:hypothetical protein
VVRGVGELAQNLVIGADFLGNLQEINLIGVVGVNGDAIGGVGG